MPATPAPHRWHDRDVSDLPASVVRPPKQERSRIAWERALDAGLEILEEDGVDALTVAAVCRRAKISAPSLYARVDGHAGLVAAVYEKGVAAVYATEQALLARIPEDADLPARIAGLVFMMTETFRRHRAIMRPIIGSSMSDPHIHGRGVEDGRRVVGIVADVLAIDPQAGHDIGTMLFAESVVRTIYGSEFYAAEPETDEEFRARLIRAARARAGV